MKLSVKWLAGLAVLVLAVVAVVGSTSATKAAAGSIFVANEWSDITNESPAPTGFTTRGTVFSTFSESGRIIQSQADIVKVVVVDADLNPSVATSINDTSPDNITVTSGGSADDITAGIGTSAVIELTGRDDEPIAGTLAQVQANTVISVDGGTTNLVGTQLTITNFYPGDPTGNFDPWIQVVVNVAGPYSLNFITYNTSIPGSAEVKVKSDLDTTGVTISAQETGIGSGRFQGWFRIVDTAVTAAGGNGQLIGTPKNIRASAGQLTFSFTDNESNNRETTVTVDKTGPTASITGPIDKSATQNTTPIFSGSISESGSGLKINTIDVLYDNSTADATNATNFVVDTATGVNDNDAVSLAVSVTGALDGDSAFTFSKAPSTGIPGNLANPDHTVDWVIKASDLAGNLSLSDADPSTTGIQLPTVKVDKVLPSFTTTSADHLTGLATSASGEVVARNSLRVALNDDVTNVQASDFTVTLDSTAVIAPTSVTVVNDTTGTFLKPLGSAAQSVVYLTFATDLVSNDTPKVSLQDTISDLAGNFTSQGDREVADGVAPSVTVTLSDGSGTGTGAESTASLTNEKITITIITDEPLSGAPSVAVHKDDVTGAEANPTALAQGTNKWTAQYVKPGTPVDGKRAIVITVTDTATNTGTVGTIDADASGTPKFVLDTVLAAPSLTVGGGSATTDQTRPSIVIDYKAASEASSVTLTKVQLDGTSITADVVAASDGKRFFYIPPSDLSLGEHKLLIEAGDATDAAGNENTTNTTLTVTIEERATFDLDVFAGWNALSFPTDPIDPDINSVFTNAGHDAVLGFDSSVPGQWRVSVRDTVSGLLEPATEGGLTSVRSTQAYWVHSNNFEQVTVLLVGEVLPASGSPPGIITIPTVLGFNAVPVVDTSRKLATGASQPLTRQPAGGGAPVPVLVADYLGAVVEGRVYRWNPEILSFELLTGSSAISTGQVLFVEVTETPIPIFP